MSINAIPQIIYECPIWGASSPDFDSQPKCEYNKDEGCYKVFSPRAGGTYRIKHETAKKLINTSEKKSSFNNVFRAKLTTWLIKQRKQGEEIPLITDEVLEHVNKRGRLPIKERIDNILKYIQEKNEAGEVSFSKSIVKTYSECANDSEFFLIYKELEKYAEITGYVGGKLDITLNAKGLEHLEALKANQVESRKIASSGLEQLEALEKVKSKNKANHAESILIKTIRVANFRGLENIEVDLESTTVLTGLNNTGKTSLLLAFKLVFRDYRFLSQDDFFMRKNSQAKKITVDTLIIPVDQQGRRCDTFSDDWKNVFTEDRIKIDKSGKSIVPLRITITFDPSINNFKREQFSMKGWPDFQSNGLHWFDEGNNGLKRNFYFNEIPFFDIGVQRDILNDIKEKKSYLGRMLSKIDYSPKDIQTIEEQIKSLNKKAVNSSHILKEITTTLKELGSAIGSSKSKVEITPFTKKIHDLNKGLSIYYSDQEESFSMEYHGMGTRSWSSLLTLKAFIALLAQRAKEEKTVFFPILTIEEPEAHLHPNAQKQLYQQINTIKGQKIISTHSTYIPTIAPIEQIRGLYKTNQIIRCGKLAIDELSNDDIMNIKRKITNTRGEIFFSQFIVFCEGETERQALPILAEKYFNKKPFEIGLDFIDVGGKGNYLPFLQFAEAFHIPWIILSDGDVRENVEKQISQIDTKNKEDKVIFLDEGNDFEKQLINDGFTDEIKKALISLIDYKNEQHKMSKEQEIKNYNSKQLYDNMVKDKVKIGHAVAKEIFKSKKDLPPKIKELFQKINDDLKIKDINNGNFS